MLEFKDSPEPDEFVREKGTASSTRVQTFPFQSWIVAVLNLVLMLMASTSSDP